MKVGLVLGAGGIQGGAWLTGGLDALAEETGWDPAEADYVVGTSAGSMIGAPLRLGHPAVVHGRALARRDLRRRGRRPRASGRRRGPRRRGALSSWSAPGRRSDPDPGGSRFARWRSPTATPRHRRHRLDPARHLLRPSRSKTRSAASCPSGWSPHPNLWIAACDYATGPAGRLRPRRSPDADLADAVAASCAIPGLYHPVTIDGRRYVDGGIYSASNADILRNEELDLVICLNPTSTLHPLRAINPRDAFNIAFQRASGRRLGSEAKKLRAAGTQVVLIQPLHDDLHAMGPNLMSTRNRNRVIEVARRTVAEQFAEPPNRELLADLPAGDPRAIRRPEGSPSGWPDWRAIRSRGVGAGDQGSSRPSQPR